MKSLCVWPVPDAMDEFCSADPDLILTIKQTPYHIAMFNMGMHQGLVGTAGEELHDPGSERTS